jgi:hypothetical protein
MRAAKALTSSRLSASWSRRVVGRGVALEGAADLVEAAPERLGADLVDVEGQLLHADDEAVRGLEEQLGAAAQAGHLAGERERSRHRGRTAPVKELHGRFHRYDAARLEAAPAGVVSVQVRGHLGTGDREHHVAKNLTTKRR